MNGILRRIALYILIASLAAGCAEQVVAISKYGFSIADVNVKTSGTSDDKKPEIMEICKGLILSEQQVREFFVYAEYIKDTDPINRYNILPCYSSGTARINGEKYQWMIRAGGVGEFFNDKNKFIQICGKNCCDKVSGIC